MTIWLTIIAMGIVTYGTRLLPLVALREEALPDWFRCGLIYVPVAVLSAIIAPEILPSPDWFAFTINGRIIAGIAAIGVARLTGNTILTIVAGLAVFLILV